MKNGQLEDKLSYGTRLRKAWPLSATIVAAGLLPSKAFCSDHVLHAQDFVNSIAVNVHTMYTDGGYDDLDRVIASLDYLGVHSLRDAAPPATALADQRYGKLAAHGFQYDFVVSTDPATTIKRLDGFLAKYPHAIEAVEGPNEVNNWPVSFNGMSGSKGAIAFQKNLFSIVKADSAFEGVPIYNFTDYPQFPGDADYFNIHPYPKAGIQPYDVLQGGFSDPTMPGKPTVITEAGYSALPQPTAWTGSSEWAPVDEQMQAILTVNFLLDAFALRGSRVYLYQLLDAYVDKPVNDADKHLGLFDLQYRPKPAADAIHNLIALLADRGGKSRALTERPFSISATGLPATGHTMILEKRDGSNVIAVWNEQAIWDSASRRELAPAVAQVTINFKGSLHGVETYDVIKSRARMAYFADAAHVDIALGRDPLLLVITPPDDSGPSNQYERASRGRLCQRFDSVIVDRCAIPRTPD